MPPSPCFGVKLLSLSFQSSVTLHFALISIRQARQSEAESDLFTDAGRFRPDSGLHVIGSAGGVAMLSSRVTAYSAYSAGILRPNEMPEPSPSSAGPSWQHQ